jgi:hypothetical protein
MKPPLVPPKWKRQDKNVRIAENHTDEPTSNAEAARSAAQVKADNGTTNARRHDVWTIISTPLAA